MTLILLKLAVAGGIGLALTGLVFLLHSHAEAQAAAGRDDADPDVDLPTQITLANGIRIANFSSPHMFHFDDGSVLGPVSEEVMLLGKLNAEEIKHPRRDGGVDIELAFSITPECTHALAAWLDKWEAVDIDIVIVPFPLLQLLRQVGWLSSVKDSPFRTIRCVDRATKLNSSTKFCV